MQNISSLREEEIRHHCVTETWEGAGRTKGRMGDNITSTLCGYATGHPQSIFTY